MSRRFRRDALEAHRRNIQVAVACVTVGVVSYAQPEQSRFAEWRALALNNGRAVPLSGSPLMIRVSQEFLVRREAASDPIEVIGYNYTIEHPNDGELVSFQWHAGGKSPIDFPHVHIGPALSRRDSVVRHGEAHKIHVPTGEVSLAGVLRLAITELGVEPRREDWDAILSRSGARP